MKKYIIFSILCISVLFTTNVYATPVNELFNDDNLYSCIIDAYNKQNGKKEVIDYNILTYELVEITNLDCTKYEGKIEDLTGLNNMTGLTSINLSGNTFLGGSITLNEGETFTLSTNLNLPNNLKLTDTTYLISDNTIASEKDGVLTALKEGSTYVTMTSKVTGNEIKEKYLISIKSTIPKSNNNNLKTLTLSNGDIEFNKNTTKYTAIVGNSVKIVTIGAILEDVKANFVENYGPRKVNLKTGNNSIQIKVKAEDGKIKTYTLNITRSDGNDDNNLLANIELSVGKIEFKSDVETYNITVDGDVDTLEITATPLSLLSTVNVSDATLGVGENKITITVTAENGNKKDYLLIVTRENYESNKNYLKDLVIKNHDINFNKNTFEYEINIGNQKQLNIVATSEKSNSTVNIIGNKNLKNGSKIIVRIIDEDNAKRDYVLNIKKLFIYDLEYKQLLLFGEFIIIFILLLIIIFKPKKRNKKKNKKSNNTFVQNKVCMKCGTINAYTSNACYVCGNELK